MNMKIDWKKILPYVVGIVVFIAVAMVYCAPALQGKVLVQGDVNNWKVLRKKRVPFTKRRGIVHGGPTQCLAVCLPTKSQVVCIRVSCVQTLRISHMQASKAIGR